MNPNINLNNSDINSLKQICIDLNNSSIKINKKLGKVNGRNIKQLIKKNQLSKWQAQHIELHYQLEKIIKRMRTEGKGDDISEDIVQARRASKMVMKKLANTGHYMAFRKAIQSTDQAVYVDSNKLLTEIKGNNRPQQANLREWKMNFGLLYSAYQRTQNEEVKEKIRFLMMNYLVKAAFLNHSTGISISEQDMKEYESMLQLGLLTLGGVYHRSLDGSNPILSALKLEPRIGSSQEGGRNIIPLDTMEVQGLYGAAFIKAPDITHTDEIVHILVSQFETIIDQFSNSTFERGMNYPVMEFPIIIDVTEQIGQSLITDGDPSKIRKYQNKKQSVRVQANEIIKQAASIVKNKYPGRQEIHDRIEDCMKTNLAIVSRAQVNDHLAVMSVCPDLFEDGDFNEPAELYKATARERREEFIAETSKVWASHAAACIGAVNLRKLMAEVNTDPLQIANFIGQTMDYAVFGRTDVKVYQNPEDITKTNTFKMLSQLAATVIDDSVQAKASEGQVLLAKATVKMMQTLLSKIKKSEWDQKQQDLAVRELTQTTLVRIQHHLAEAMHHVDDWRRFSQAIDRTHAELTALLVLYSPFDEQTFSETYAKFIKSNLPPDLQASLVVGIGRSAMNIFAGINAAVLKNQPQPIRICGAHSYYEEAAVVGGNRTLDAVLQNPDIKKVDLYVAEFYHNIDIDPNYTNYQKGTVIQDIKNIFAHKPDTDQLTVALDGTIDFAQSEDVKKLFKEFEQEIKDGKLNIVVFRSGQKFDMLGFDNYYGSLFYMVNNGDKKWDEFNKIKTHEAFHTDQLSQQFFTWMAETGPGIVDEYKAQIFKNTRNILNLVPPELQPGEDKNICVCQFDEDVKTPFIDIKLNLANEDQKEELWRWVQERFMHLYIAEHKLVYRRGSFGFVHPNITWIDPKMRINPGLNSDENKIYRQLFKELADKVKDMQQSSAS